ncbi:MAG: hypothetical protein ABFR47_03765, partial [Verrucomicrobiota bacterium]
MFFVIFPVRGAPPETATEEAFGEVFLAAVFLAGAFFAAAFLAGAFFAAAFLAGAFFATVFLAGAFFAAAFLAGAFFADAFFAVFLVAIFALSPVKKVEPSRFKGLG